MDLISTNTINITALGLDGLSARHKAITSNIANADTPDYKRMDVTFEDQLGKIISTEHGKESQRLANSIAMSDNSSSALPLSVNHNQAMMEMADFKPKLLESDQNQPNNNGNTVDIEQEMATLAKNGMTYNALATLQAKAFRGLSAVLRGQ